MKELSVSEIEIVSGAGDINWVQVGRDVVTSGATVAGGAFGLGLGGPIGAGIVGTAAGAAAGALYDSAGYNTDLGTSGSFSVSDVQTMGWCNFNMTYFSSSQGC